MEHGNKCGEEKLCRENQWTAAGKLGMDGVYKSCDWAERQRTKQKRSGDRSVWNKAETTSCLFSFSFPAPQELPPSRQPDRT